MTEEPGNKYGSFYGQPTPGLPFGQPAAPAGPAQHPCASLFATRDDAEDGGGGIGKAVVVVVLILLLIGAGVGVVMLGGPSALMPKRSQAAAMANNPQAVDAAVSQVEILRSQIALYGLQHENSKPTLAELQDNWGVFVRRTYSDGSFVPQGAENVRDKRRGVSMGPYVQQPPVNPLTNSSKVVAAGSASADAGWTYDQVTGHLLAVSPADTEAVRSASDCFEVVK